MQVQNPHAIKYNGTIQGLKYIWKSEGFRGLFKGNGTNCARIVPNSAVKFYSYEQASKYVFLFLLFQFWFHLSDFVIIFKRSLLYAPYLTPYRGILWLYRQQSGNGMMIPIFFFSYHYNFFIGAKSILLKCYTFVINYYNYLPFPSMAEDAELSPLLRLGAGACAGIIAMSATYPMDMVRGRLTVQVF